MKDNQTLAIRSVQAFVVLAAALLMLGCSHVRNAESLKYDTRCVHW